MSKKSNPLEDLELQIQTEKELNAAESARKELDWKWFQYDLWVSGNHYAKYDRNSQQILVSPRSDGRPKVVINMVYWTLRSIRNYVMRNDPKPDVMPEDMTDENLDDAVVENKFLSFLHNRLGLRQKLRMSLWHALKYSNGYWLVLWDDEADEGKGSFKVVVVDPYDLYWDPVAKEPSEARYAWIEVRRNLDDLKKDPLYKDVDWDAIQTDSKLAASSLKARIMQYEKGGATYNNDKEAGTVILKEGWRKKKTKVDNEDGTSYTKDTIQIVSKIGKTIIRKEDTDLTIIPIFRLPADVEPLSMNGQGWVKNLIPMNREINRLESSAAEYNDVMNKAKFMAPKGHGIRTINNEHGQIIEYKPGKEPQQLQIMPLGSALEEQAMRMITHFENGASFHDASLGRIPTGAKSGVSIEALQEGDSNNLSELVENTEIFLEQVYEYILTLAATKYQFARNIAPSTQTGEREFIKVIGEDATNKPEGAQVIHKKNVVDVKIDSYLAYTQEGRQQAIKDLVQMIPNMDPMDILQAYKTGNIADIVKRIQEREQKQQQQQMEQDKAQAQNQAQAQGQVQQQNNAQQAQIKQQQMQQQSAQQQSQQPQPAGMAEAIAVIRMVLTGHMPTQLPKSVSPEYINYFDKFLTSQEAQTLPKDVQKVLLQIRDQGASTSGGQTQQNQLAQ